MTTLQKVIKYLAIAFAIFLIVTIFGGIIDAVGIFGGLFSDGEAVAEDIKSYSVSTEIRNLDIEINAAELHIKEGKALLVESNLKNLKVEEKDGYLTVTDPTKIKLAGSNLSEYAILTIYVPTDVTFKAVNISTGAGRLTVDTLSAEAIDFELGAGEVSLNALYATKSARIEGGAGRISISGGELNDLDMEMGIGELTLKSALTGSCQLDMGVGKSDITLIGSKDDYKIDIDKGLGSISVDGAKISDFGSSGNGTNQVKINGGIGAIDIEFKDAK